MNCLPRAVYHRIMEGAVQRVLVSMLLSPLFYAVVLIAIWALVLWVSQRKQRRRRKTEYEFFIELTRSMGISEYDAFIHAARVWDIPEHRVEVDFKGYLRSGNFPPYVSQFIAKGTGPASKEGQAP